MYGPSSLVLQYIYWSSVTSPSDFVNHFPKSSPFPQTLDLKKHPYIHLRFPPSIWRMQKHYFILGQSLCLCCWSTLINDSSSLLIFSLFFTNTIPQLIKASIFYQCFFLKLPFLLILFIYCPCDHLLFSQASWKSNAISHYQFLIPH